MYLLSILYLLIMNHLYKNLIPGFKLFKGFNILDKLFQMYRVFQEYWYLMVANISTNQIILLKPCVFFISVHFHNVAFISSFSYIYIYIYIAGISEKLVSFYNIITWPILIQMISNFNSMRRNIPKFVV